MERWSGATKLSKGATTLCLNQSLFPKKSLSSGCGLLSLVQLNCKQAAVAPDGQQEIKQGYYIRHSLYPAAAVTIHQTAVAEREEAVIVKLNGIQRNKKKSGHPKSHILFAAKKEARSPPASKNSLLAPIGWKRDRLDAIKILFKT